MFPCTSSNIILEVWKCWRLEICKYYGRQMTHLKRWWCQTSASRLVQVADVNTVVWAQPKLSLFPGCAEGPAYSLLTPNLSAVLIGQPSTSYHLNLFCLFVGRIEIENLRGKETSINKMLHKNVLSFALTNYRIIHSSRIWHQDSQIMDINVWIWVKIIQHTKPTWILELLVTDALSVLAFNFFKFYLCNFCSVWFKTNYNMMWSW